MNYTQAYVNLIFKAKQRNTKDLEANKKCEWHHYFPVCFWRDKKANRKMVLLTVREHWVAHRLLFKIFPSQGTAAALICMSKRDPKMNSRKFEAIRAGTAANNWTKSEEGRALLSMRMKKRWDAGEWSNDEVRKKWAEEARRKQEEWRKHGNHPLSSSVARQNSRRRAQERNSVIAVCNKCGAVIGGGSGNMTQHQRGEKCAANMRIKMVESRQKDQ